MRWAVKPDDGWRNRFAFLPIKFDEDGTWIWLEWYQAKDMGIFTQIRLNPPATPQQQPLASRRTSRKAPPQS